MANVRKPRRLMRNSKFAIRNSRYEIQDRKFGIRHQQNMADAAEETLRVCGSSGMVFAFNVGPHWEF